jgi:multidrug efflux pump
VFFKVGLIAIIGLSAKNAILIIEFARDPAGAGHGPSRGHARSLPPALPADPDDLDRLHLRRAAAGISTGAGANSRHAIGTGVMGGMISATVLAVFLVPVFFVVVRRIFPGHSRHHHQEAGHE